MAHIYCIYIYYFINRSFVLFKTVPTGNHKIIIAPPSECQIHKILHNRHLSVTDIMHSPDGVRYGQVSLYIFLPHSNLASTLTDEFIISAKTHCGVHQLTLRA